MSESEDSIDFFARYKDWVAARSIVIGASADPKEVAAYLVSVREDIDRRGFEVLGISLKVLDEYAEKITKGLPKGYAGIVDIYKSLGSAETEEEMNKATKGNEQIKPFAKAYILRSALQRLGVDFYLTKENRAFGAKVPGHKSTTNVPFTSEGISFMAKYKEWVSIKKLSIHPDTKPEEVAAHLSSIRLAIDRKAPAILGINVENLDIYANSTTENLRKSAANLEKITTLMGSADAKKEIDAACMGDMALRDAAQTYLFGKMLRNIKIDVEISPDTLMDMFPGLKIPKPKGRMPGQKKKKQ